MKKIAIDWPISTKLLKMVVSFQKIGCMDTGNMADWGSAICAVITVVAAGFAWWQSNLSKKAKADAEAAEQSAAEQFELARAQAQAAVKQADSAKASNEIAQEHLAEFKRIASSLRGPEFRIEQLAKSRFMLIYSGEEPVTASVRNLADFGSLNGLNDSLTFEPGQAVEFIAVGSWDTPMPSELILDIEGRDNPVRVPLIRSM